MKATLIALLILIVLSAIIFAPRIYKDVKKKRNYANTYAIQNVGTGKDIRVHNAGNDNGTKIILYNHNNWECITWQLIELEDNAYLLKNLYTQKPSNRQHPRTGCKPVATNIRWKSFSILGVHQTAE